MISPIEKIKTAIRKAVDAWKEKTWFDFYGIPYEDMYEFLGDEYVIVKKQEYDHLRKEDNARRNKARMSAMQSNIDNLGVSGVTVLLKGAEKDKAVKFIQSLGEFGYDVDALMEEYNKEGMITI